MTTRIDRVEIAADGTISVRKVLDDGTFWRGVREPGADVSDLSSSDKASVQSLWTSEFVTAWQAAAASG